MQTISLLAQSPSITNWLTPLWLLSVGVGLGFVLVLLALLKLWLFAKTSLIEKLSVGRMGWIWGTLLSLIYVALGMAIFFWNRLEFRFEEFTHPATRQLILEETGLCLLIVLPLGFLLGFGVFKLASPQGFRELWSLQREGFLKWMNWICVGMILFAVTGFALALVNGFGLIKFVDDPYALLNSATRLPLCGNFVVEAEIQPSETKVGGTEVPVSFYGQEVGLHSFVTNQPLQIATEPVTKELPVQRTYSLNASENYQVFMRNPDGSGQIPDGLIDKLYVLNIGNNPASLEFRYRTQPVHEQVWIIPWAAVCVLLLYSLYWVTASLFPKVFAIAYSTFKTEVHQPLFLIVLLAGFGFIMLSIYIPYYTFGEDIKMYKDSGLTLIRVMAIFVAVWAASKSVAEEIDGRTALTVLSKPVGRRQFILGKFAGISLMVGLLFLLLGIWFIIWTAYKPIYDGREQVAGLVDWEVSFIESMGIIPALFLGFLEVLIFVVISIAISTRLGILPNFLICFAIYVVGHLTTLIVQSSVGEFEVVRAFANLVSVVFPVLDHFDVQAAISNNRSVPILYLAWGAIYCVLYGTVALLLALILFEDRDLA